jgi:uncharacterized protein YjbI with pentapeptide repeats
MFFFLNCKFKHCRFEASFEHNEENLVFKNCEINDSLFCRAYLDFPEGNVEFLGQFKNCNFEHIEIGIYGETNTDHINLLLPYISHVYGFIQNSTFINLEVQDLFSEIEFYQCNFENCNFSHSKIQSEKVPACTFLHTQLHFCQLEGDFDDINFYHVDLKGSRLEGSFLFWQVSLEDVDLREASICIDRPTHMKNVILSNHISYNFLEYATDLSGVDLSHRNLSKLDLSNKILIGTQFYSADLSAVNFSKSNLYQADFRFSNLENANFKHAFICQANFDQAKVGGIDFIDCFHDISEFILPE